MPLAVSCGVRIPWSSLILLSIVNILLCILQPDSAGLADLDMYVIWLVYFSRNIQLLSRCRS